MIEAHERLLRLAPSLVPEPDEAPAARGLGEPDQSLQDDAIDEALIRRMWCASVHVRLCVAGCGEGRSDRVEPWQRKPTAWPSLHSRRYDVACGRWMFTSRERRRHQKSSQVAARGSQIPGG
jgi:hypothetical protein